MSQLIFAVASDVEFCWMLRYYLEKAGFEFCEFITTEILQEVQARRPALILIDTMMKDGQGFDLCHRIRQTPTVAKIPVILVIAGTALEDCAKGLNAGGDDCVSGPNIPRELIPRIWAVLQRTDPLKNCDFHGPVLRVGQIELDTGGMKVSVGGKEITTTTLEFRLIEYLARHQGRVFTRDQLLDAVWGDARFVTPRTVDACVRRIRNKIESEPSGPTYLKTIRGVGYRLDAAQLSTAASLAATGPWKSRFTGSSLSD
jgi:DNA-binding response OmpR family regulator